MLVEANPNILSSRSTELVHKDVCVSYTQTVHYLDVTVKRVICVGQLRVRLTFDHQ